MRKRRQVLQVSTFPFLAVLLCAMGSLILLLLVIDRQAKAVARNKARLAAAKLAEEATGKQKKLADDRLAEWAQRRAELHAQLARRQEELAGAVKAARGKVDSTVKNTDAEAVRSSELRRRLDAELARLLAAQGELTERRAEAAKAGDKVEAAKGEKARLAEDLAKMERAVRALKELREREKQTYSLVPYKGRRGDGRRPLYLECSSQGVIFHPDRLTLPGSAELRAEVERRVAQRRQEDAGKTKADPYLLMLVRPEGVLTYYRALRTLDGLKVGFGYEFIDEDWVLDFSGDADASRVQPWMVAQPSGALPGQGALPRPPRGIMPRGTPPTAGAAGAEVPDDGLPHPRNVLGSAAVSGTGGTARAGGGSGGTSPGSAAGGGFGSGSGTGPGNIASLGLPSYGPSGLLQPGGSGGPFFGGRGSASPGGTGRAGGSGSSGIPGVGGGSGGGGWGPGGGGAGRGTGSAPPLGGGPSGTGPFTGTGPVGVGMSNGIALGSGAGTGGSSGTGTPGAYAGVSGSGGGLRPRGVLGGSGYGSGNGGEPGGADGPRLGWQPGGGQAEGSATASGTSAGAGTGAGTPDGIGGPRTGSQPGNDQGAPNGSALGGGSPGVPGATGTGVGTGQSGGTFAQARPSGSGQAAGSGAGGGSAGGAAGGSGDGAAGSSADGMTGGNPSGGTGGSTGGAAGGSAGGSGGMPGGNASGTAGSSGGGSPGASGGSAAGGQPGAGSAAGTKGGRGEEGLGGPPLPALLQSPAGSERRPARPAPPPLSRIIGDRDWVIAVECKSDALIVQPWGLPFTATPPAAGQEHPLVTRLRQLIARRQATVRTGEPPYRPMIRFRVHPDGLRSYYFAYPLLETLGVPMSREYVDPPNPLTGR